MAETATGRQRYQTDKQDLEWSEEQAAHDRRQNIGDMQRVLSAVTGIALLVSGLPKRSWTGAALAMAGGGLLHRAVSGYCAAFDTLGVDMSGGRETNRIGRRKVHSDAATKIRRTIEIDRPPSELYRFWRRLDNLPRIMSHLESVQVISDKLSHWTVKTIAGAPAVEWDAEIINDVENERIGWRSLNDADVDNTGSVEFQPIAEGQKTRMTVTLQYAPPAGKIGAAFAKLIGQDPERKLAEDLQRFKEQMQTETDLGEGESKASPVISHRYGS